MKLLTRQIQILFGIAASAATTALAQVNHMVVIGVDGMSPDGVLKANAPNLKRFYQQGAWTFQARGVMPTSSSPNWASMIMGAGPEQHGVTSNDWQPDKFDIAPVVKGPGGIFPTIFSVLRQQQPKAVVGVFHDWGDYGRLFERSMVDVIQSRIIIGPGIRAGHEIKSPVNTYDTAATIAFAFGLTPPVAWIARPVAEAFASR